MQQNLNPQQMMDREPILTQVKQQATSALMFNKLFLHPFEVKLKQVSSHPQGIPIIQNTLNPQSLPQGLLLAYKQQGISSNAYEQKHFIPLSERIETVADLKTEYLDNMISYLKPTEKADTPIKLIICICMYSEDQKMLKGTISGVRQNIRNLLLNQGMDADSIAVFVIIDGIMSIDPSILRYINQLQQQSLLYLSDYKYLKDQTDIQRQKTQRNERVYNQQYYVKDNINNFLFTQRDFNEFRDKRLPKVYEEYKELLDVKRRLEILKKYTNIRNVYDQLPYRVQNDFFPTTAKKFCKQKYGLSNEEIDQDTLNSLKLNTQDGITVTSDTITAALNHIERYMDSRDKLTYVAPFRLLYDEDNVDIQFEHEQQSQEEMLRRNHVGFNKLHLNLFICVKYKNSGKLSSHNWFFNGFCKELSPKYTILMDVGLVPKPLAIVKMITQMQKDKTIGGVCGYMCLREEKNTDEQIDDEQLQSLTNYTKCFSDIQKTQMLQYHLSHVMDKAFETAFGFIHVLPGAFSGYNMQALKSKGNDRDRLLGEYFKSIQDKIIQNKIKPTNLSLIQILFRIFIPTLIYNFLFTVEKESQEELLYNQNIFFAEDRILCMEIYKNGFKLVYIPDAISYVDPIKSIHRLMGQRKRWINGSLFAYQKVRKEIYALKGWHLKLRIQVYFYDFINCLIYFSPSIFFFTINISVLSFNERIIRPILNLQFGSENIEQIQTILATISSTFNYIYAMILFTMIFYSLNLTALNKYFKISIYFQSAILGTIALIIIIIYLIDTADIFVGDGFFFIDNANISQSAKDIIPIHRIIILLIFVSYIVSILVYSICFCTFRVIGDTIKSALSFVFYTPTYFIILNFYALCRMDDISWGTKGLDHSNSKQVNLKTKWTLIKLIHVFRYIIWNGAASILLFLMSKTSQPKLYISFFIACCILFIIGTKTIIGSIYIIFYKLKSICSSVCHRKDKREKMYQGRESRIRFISNLLSQKKQQIYDRVGQFQFQLTEMATFTQALIKLG